MVKSRRHLVFVFIIAGLTLHQTSIYTPSKAQSLSDPDLPMASSQHGYFRYPLFNLPKNQWRNGFSTSLLTHTSNISLPFWLTTNRGGIIPLESSAGVVVLQDWSHPNLLAHPNYTHPNWILSAEASLFLQNSRYPKTHQPESNLSATESTAGKSSTRAGIQTLSAHLTGYNFVRLSAGRFHQTIGIGAPYLTTGQMMMSLNARPAWKISLENPDFFAIPGTRGFLNFKAHWSESFLFDDRFVDRPKIHQKYLYVNLKPVPELSLMGGIIHGVMYGGTHPTLGSLDSVQGYIDSVTGLSEANEATPPGNGIAAYDFGPAYHAKKWSAGAMRLFFLEDRVSMRFRSPWDGMWSGWFHWTDRSSLPWIDYVVYEHINTKKQDARSIDALGAARYYTHDVWRGGWTHEGHLLGNPLLSLDPGLIPEIARPVTNGILVAHHVGIMGNVAQGVRWEMMMTYSRNYGVCEDQFTEVEVCNSKDGTDLRSKPYYVPLKELRKDRYSLFGGVIFDTRRQPKPHRQHGEAKHRRKNGRNISGRWGWLDVPVRFHIYTGLDWGDFFDKPRMGAEFGLMVFY